MPRGGKREGAGRKKGVPNKRTQEAAELLEALEANSLEALVRLARRAEEEEDFQLAVAAWKEIAQYQYAKRKAIEHSGDASPIKTLEVVLTGPNAPDGKTK